MQIRRHHHTQRLYVHLAIEILSLIMVARRPLYFHPVVCSSFCFFFFSSPNLSRRRVDVRHTCTHGVALVRI